MNWPIDLSYSLADDYGEDDNCERCQGNGEIVVNWELYLNPPEGASADAGTSRCPDCQGSFD